MLMFRVAATICLLSPWLVSAALFPSKTEVKMIDAKGFHKVMKHNVSVDTYLLHESSPYRLHLPGALINLPLLSILLAHPSLYRLLLLLPS